MCVNSILRPPFPDSVTFDLRISFILAFAGLGSTGSPTAHPAPGGSSTATGTAYPLSQQSSRFVPALVNRFSVVLPCRDVVANDRPAGPKSVGCGAPASEAAVLPQAHPGNASRRAKAVPKTVTLPVFLPCSLEVGFEAPELDRPHLGSPLGFRRGKAT